MHGYCFLLFSFWQTVNKILFLNKSEISLNLIWLLEIILEVEMLGFWIWYLLAFCLGKSLVAKYAFYSIAGFSTGISRNETGQYNIKLVNILHWTKRRIHQLNLLLWTIYPYKNKWSAFSGMYVVTFQNVWETSFRRYLFGIDGLPSLFKKSSVYFHILCCLLVTWLLLKMLSITFNFYEMKRHLVYRCIAWGFLFHWECSCFLNVCQS